MRIKTYKYKEEKGAVALFMAISVSIIFSIIVLYSYSSQLENKKTKAKKTYEKLETIEKTLVAYIRTTGVIPCPAFNLSLGIEGCISNNFIGLLPYKTIGLSKKYAFDEYGNSLTYIADRNHTYITSNNDNLRVINSLSDNPNDAPQASFILISHGKNGYGAITPDKPAPTSNQERKNTLAFGADSTEFAGYETSFIKQKHSQDFDDFVTFVKSENMF